MSATNNGLTFLPVADKPQPSSSPGLIRRDLILNFTTGQTTQNFSGGAAGLGVLLSASGVGIGGNTVGLCVNNTANSGNTLDLISGGVQFLQNSTVAGSFIATVLSTQ